MDLYGLKYNNYFNRIIKKENDAIGYFNAATLKATQFNVSFNPNDGVTTTQIVNNGPEQHWEECDYVIITEKQTSSVNIQFVNALEDTVSETDKAKMIAIMIKHTTYNETLSRQILDIVDNSPYKTQFSCKTLPDAVQMFNEIKADDTLYNIYTGNIISGTSAINSRWFIIECQRTRSGQYSLQLKRDVIADNYDAVIDAPCYIQKAIVPNVSDPAIYNQENAILNEIKSDELLIKDDTNVAWIVGYMAPNTPDVTDISTPASNLTGLVVDGIDNWEYYRYVTNDYKVYSSMNVKLKVTMLGPTSARISAYYFNDDGSYDSLLDNNFYGRLTYNTINTLPNTVARFSVNYKSNKSALHSIVDANLTDYTKVNNLSKYNNRFIFDRVANKYYKITVTASAQTSYTEIPTRDSTTSYDINNLFAEYRDGLHRYTTSTSGTTANVVIEYTAKPYRVTLTEVTANSYSTRIDANANLLLDAPYKMFAIPYGSVNVNYISGGGMVTTIGATEALSVACTAAIKLGAHLYDLQLLPYCPVPELFKKAIIPGTDDYFALANKVVGTDYQLIKQGDHTVGFIFYPRSSQLEFNIFKTIAMPATVEDRKLAIQCDNYRLVSPNGSGDFQFNLVKVGGIKKFTVDCTYKPYNPYIHVAPDFKALYGSDYNDYRGLICGGDYSLPVINSEWQNYQIQNKNYQKIFDREIANLEINQKHQRIEQAVGIAAGAVQGATQGAKTGMALGNGAAGAVIGAGIGVAGGIVDWKIGEESRKENMSYQHDMYNYNLQNIKARPNALVKSTALDANNKLFPYLEYYTCTEAEKNWMTLKFKYDGMTIDRIDKISTFINDNQKQFVKGELIRVEELSDNYRLATDIYSEIAKGVYL